MSLVGGLLHWPISFSWGHLGKGRAQGIPGVQRFSSDLPLPHLARLLWGPHSQRRKAIIDKVIFQGTSVE